MGNKKLASLFLRLGIAFSFIYAGISAFLNPQAWIGFFPVFLQNSVLLVLHSIFVILLGVWLLWGKKVFYAATVSAVFIFLVVIFNLNSLDLLFRDVSIMLAAIALAILEHRK